jgi:hypothetical protein
VDGSGWFVPRKESWKLCKNKNHDLELLEEYYLWGCDVPPERRLTYTRLHGVLFYREQLFMVTAVEPRI